MYIDAKDRSKWMEPLAEMHGKQMHGSVVRTSVFGWQTFHDPRLIYGWHVTTLLVKFLLWVNQSSQLGLPSLQGWKAELAWLAIYVS